MTTSDGEARSTPDRPAPNVEAPLPSRMVGEDTPFQVVIGPEPTVLGAIASPKVGLASWARVLASPLADAAVSLLHLEPFEEAAAGVSEDVVESLLALLPPAFTALRGDLLELAELFCTHAGCSRIRMRIEHTLDQICPNFHVDAVRLRLLCTYFGPGTEWLDARKSLHRMTEGHVALMKGTRWPGFAATVRHRSPDVSNLPPEQRQRLLVVIDEDLLH